MFNLKISQKKKVKNKNKRDNKVIIDTHVNCKASEVGKIIVNKCLERGNEINLYKLELLLVLAQGYCLSLRNGHMFSGKALFKEPITAANFGFFINQVQTDLIEYGIMGFKSQLQDYICLLDHEEEAIDLVLEKYGNMDAFKLMDLPELELLYNVSYKGKPVVVTHEIIKQVFDKFVI